MLGQLDMFGLMKVDSDIEKVFEKVESIRRKRPYVHRNCHPNCKARGNVFVTAFSSVNFVIMCLGNSLNNSLVFNICWSL